MMAYKNTGDCTDFMSCLKRALRSACRVGGSCRPNDPAFQQIDVGMLKRLAGWFEKQAAWPIVPQAESGTKPATTK
jgi:hypothetical protein